MKARPVIARPAAALGLIEAAHSGAGDLHAWLEGVLVAGRAFLTSPMLNAGVGLRHRRQFDIVAAASAVPGVLDYWRGLVARRPAEEFDPFWRFPRHVGTSEGVVSAGAKPAELQKFLGLVGARDILGLVAIVDDYSLLLGAPDSERIELSAAERQLLMQVALHLEAGLRLRLRPGSPIAVLRPDGRLLHAEGHARDQTRLLRGLSGHVGKVEHGRGRRQRQQPESVRAWSALISGQWGLVEREEPSIGRHYVVLETTRARHLRALTEMEAHVLELSARGLTGKGVAYALGVSIATVSKQLANAAVKFGVRNRTTLVRLAAGLLGSGPRQDTAQLTRSEREVLALVRLGWTNARIAVERGRSERTVANQVAAIMAKMAVPSRRALAAVADADDVEERR